MCVCVCVCKRGHCMDTLKITSYVYMYMYMYIGIYIYIYVCNSCMPVCVMQLFCHPKYSILYGALMIFVVGSGQE